MEQAEGVVDPRVRTNGLRAVAQALGNADATATRTLKTAIIGGEKLLDRLAALEETVHRVAVLVGGNMPAMTHAEVSSDAASLMDSLNDLNDAAHARVSGMECSFAAIIRALGAEE